MSNLGKSLAKAMGRIFPSKRTRRILRAKGDIYNGEPTAAKVHKRRAASKKARKTRQQQRRRQK